MRRTNYTRQKLESLKRRRRRDSVCFGLVTSLLVLAMPLTGCLSVPGPSQPNPASTSLSSSLPVTQRFNLRTPMRDGVELSADAWMPMQEGLYPAILVRTCYGKKDWNTKYPEVAPFFASRGYVFLVQEVRGTGDSDGFFDFLFQEGRDGYDTVEWVAQQDWCNGRVGMMGVSYSGAVQWLAARERPPHLTCIAPTAACGLYLNELPAVGGVFYLSWTLPWLMLVSGGNLDTIDWDSVFRHRPLLDADLAAGTKTPLYREFLQHPTLDDYWKQIQFTAEDFPKIEIPVLNTTGWFDADQPGALYYWRGMEAAWPNRSDQFLIVGPWTHFQTFSARSGRVNSLQFTPDTMGDSKETHLAFFDRYLKDTPGAFNQPRARIYLTGANQWRESTQYPPAELHAVPYYLHSGGNANTMSGDGFLNLEKPINEQSDRFTFSPTNPVPLASNSLAFDCRLVEIRRDVLVYTSSPLALPLQVLGRVRVELWAASDARDTDFTARLVDVSPDGQPINLGCEEFGGAIRARFRSGLEKETLLEPGSVEKYTIDLFDIGHVFLPGHQLRLEISSSAFPILHPNPNTGNPIATDSETQVAQQTVFHGWEHPSALILPLLP
jgi:putative CocE/NonD family hydrolase